MLQHHIVTPDATTEYHSSSVGALHLRKSAQYGTTVSVWTSTGWEVLVTLEGTCDTETALATVVALLTHEK